MASITEPGLVGACRAGFEPELAAEFTERAAAAGIAGYARTERGSGLVSFLCDASDAEPLARALPWRDVIFARTVLRLLANLGGLDPKDRITPVIAALAGHAPFGMLWVEHADSDAGRPLSGLARSFGNALRPALRKSGLLTAKDDPSRARLHVLLLAGDHLQLAVADPANAAPWPLGIPRLRMHADAPSRSALKLEESLLSLLDDRERSDWLRPGMRAADLGAAPGGWTWVLAREGLHVTAIDNGPLRQSLMDSDQVAHLREDGFSWHPREPLDWMVCDMVEQPVRVASRMATWLREGWCQRTIFNLKLPMKKRWQETVRCLELIEREAGIPLRLRAKQLYHDREEITVLATPAARR